MTVRDVIERHGHFAHGGNPDDTAETWIESGFEAHEVEEWLSARCFDPNVARDLADAGVSPVDARMKTGAGAGRLRRHGRLQGFHRGSRGRGGSGSARRHLSQAAIAGPIGERPNHPEGGFPDAGP